MNLELLAYFLLYVLSLWRLTNLLVYEEGPFDVFKKIRDVVGINPDEVDQKGYWAKLLSCHLCCSLMLSLVTWPFFLASPLYFTLAAGWLGVGTIVILIYKLQGE